MKTEDVARYWEGNAEAWTRQARAGYDVYRDALNTPAFLDMLPPISGLAGIDLGCGEGGNTRKLAERGARMTGIDVAPTFIRHATEAEAAQPLGVTYLLADAHALPFGDGAFDFATAFMSLMDMPEPEKAIKEAGRIIAPGGFLQFSILHPCFVPPYRKTIRRMDGSTRAIEVGDYFNETYGHIDRWHFSALPHAERATVAAFEVPRFHRTLTTWVDMIGASGLMVEKLGEPYASEEVAKAEPIVEDTRVTPIFLHVRARKLKDFRD